MINTNEGKESEKLAEFYQEAFRVYDRDREPPQVEVSFYPYIGINHTIRIRNGRVYVRIAEVCRQMPDDGQRALAFILVAKLYRRRVPKRARDVYSGYATNAEIRDRAAANKRVRGRKIVTTDKGEFFDLAAIFDRLNAEYFDGALPKPTLTWSARKTYRILGHHDATHDTIVVSRSLDSKDTPKFVVDYIVFHEMLHIHHPTIHHNGRRYNHTAAFRADEEKFDHFEAAEKWIEQNVRRLKRNAKKK
ncbi:MAG: M48 family metallopeptidase [Acidobacteria bacterium]|nr:M48 family metallopeptidase [Acidobacteriota bacterium]